VPGVAAEQEGEVNDDLPYVDYEAFQLADRKTFVICHKPCGDPVTLITVPGQGEEWDARESRDHMDLHREVCDGS
jgi:hypothetical protein